MWQYIFESWVWSLGGLGAGYLLGRTERQIREVKKKVEEKAEEKDDDT